MTVPPQAGVIKLLACAVALIVVAALGILWWTPSSQPGTAARSPGALHDREASLLAGAVTPTDPVFRDSLRVTLLRSLGDESGERTAAADDLLEWLGAALADDVPRVLAQARSQSLAWFFDCYSPRESREFDIATRRMRRSELELLDRPPQPYESMSVAEWAAFIEIAPLADLFLVRGQMESPVRRVLADHTKVIRIEASTPSDDRLQPIQAAFETTLDTLAAKHGRPQRFSIGPPVFVACDDGGTLSPYYDFAESLGVIVACESEDGRLSALLTVFVRHPQRGWIPSLILTRTWLLRADAPDAPWRPRI